jgi:hypothetical protein
VLLRSLITLSLVAVAGVSVAQERALLVQLASGRQFAGALDAASSAEQLVLRTNDGGLTLRRPVRWDRVISATLDSQPIALAELKKLAAEARSLEPAVRSQGVRRMEFPAAQPSLLEAAEAAAQPVALPLPPVATISFDAFIANWDGDVETDGLVVDLLPLDQFGQLIPAGGTVEVELFASQRRIMLQHAPKSGGDTFERVERWSQAILPEQIGPSGVRLRLPFGQIHPELDLDWLAYTYGLVHVRFIVPGSGVFDASRDGVRMRPWAPNRDYLEMNTGRRFLPTENLGRRN